MHIVSPFPSHHISKVYDWAHEYPSANIDDHGPQTRAAFIQEMEKRRIHRELSWGIMNEHNEPVGIVGFIRQTPRMGSLHGILFPKGKTSPAERRAALREILDGLHLDGVEKICASYYATNAKIGKFLKELGFTKEGYLVKHSDQAGVPIDMVLVAKFAPGTRQ